LRTKIKKINTRPALRNALQQLLRDDAQERALIGLNDLKSLMVSSSSDDKNPGIPEGISVLLNYIVRDQTVNILNQLQPKAMGLIKDAVSAHIKNKEPTIAPSAETALRKELMKRIKTPTSRARTRQRVTLDESDLALVARLRNGFFPGSVFDDEDRSTMWLDDDYFKKITTPARKKTMLPMIITHFVKCLIAQESLDDGFQPRPYVSELNAKKRSPLPLFQKGLQHINLDARMLYFVIKYAKTLEYSNGRSPTEPNDPTWLKSAGAFEKVRPLVRQWIHRVFDFHRWKHPRSGGGKWRISDDEGVFVTTNGFDVSVLLRNREDEVTRDREDEVTLRQSNRVLNLSPAHDDDDEEEDDDDVSMESIPDDRPTFVASIDPGRRNIIYCIITDTDGKFLKRVVLTRAGYYDNAKIVAVRDRINERNRKEELKKMYTAFSDNHFLTSDDLAQVQAFKTYVSYHTTLWTEKTRKWWYRQRFHVYQNKERVIDNLLNDIGADVTVDGVTYVLGEVRYEDGNFPSGRRTEQYVP